MYESSVLPRNEVKLVNFFWTILFWKVTQDLSPRNFWQTRQFDKDCERESDAATLSSRIKVDFDQLQIYFNDWSQKILLSDLRSKSAIEAVYDTNTIHQSEFYKSHFPF